MISSLLPERSCKGHHRRGRAALRIVEDLTSWAKFTVGITRGQGMTLLLALPILHASIMHFRSCSVPKRSLLRVVLVLLRLLWSKVAFLSIFSLIQDHVGFGNLFCKLALEFSCLGLSGFIGDLLFMAKWFYKDDMRIYCTLPAKFLFHSFLDCEWGPAPACAKANKSCSIYLDTPVPNAFIRALAEIFWQ